eukprot:scaffold2410_cov22-Prasinocladus_malaysianus.AAC.1
MRGKLAFANDHVAAKWSKTNRNPSHQYLTRTLEMDDRKTNVNDKLKNNNDNSYNNDDDDVIIIHSSSLPVDKEESIVFPTSLPAYELCGGLRVGAAELSLPLIGYCSRSVRPGLACWWPDRLDFTQ